MSQAGLGAHSNWSGRSIGAGVLAGLAVLLVWIVLERAILGAAIGSFSLVALTAVPVGAGAVSGRLVSTGRRTRVAHGGVTGVVLAIGVSLAVVGVVVLDGLDNPVDVVEPTVTGAVLLGVLSLLLVGPYFLILGSAGAFLASTGTIPRG